MSSNNGTSSEIMGILGNTQELNMNNMNNMNSSSLEYTVESGSSIETLIEQVKSAIKQGWTPQGGLSALDQPDMNGDRFFQPMLRYETQSMNKPMFNNQDGGRRKKRKTRKNRSKN
jgi:hypothetical protein